MKYLKLVSKNHVFAIVILCSFCNYDRVSNHYKNYNDFKRSGIIEHGWIGAVLPSEISDIYEVHDLDTNRISVVFEIDKRYILHNLIDDNRFIEDEKVRKVFCDKFFIKKKRINLGSPEIKFYKISNRDIFLAVDFAGSVCYYYEE